MIAVIVGAVAWAAAVVAGFRWLRVAQREHYLAGSATRFALRWWSIRPENKVGAVLALVAAVLVVRFPIAGLVTSVIVAGGPIGLPIRGRTAPLAWTSRLRRLAAATMAVAIVLAAGGASVGIFDVASVWMAVLVPLLVDFALLVMTPLERRRSEGFVEQARRRLADAAPSIVAITGSYGKTTTKSYVAKLLGAGKSVVVSPASFNNRLGLARAINEHLTPGTEVFVAEMGTYGPGEIAELCEWIPPAVSVITAIGPVHLERFGSLDAVAEAKAEIVADASTLVLNVDDPHLSVLADREQDRRRVIRCSTADPRADVYVDGERGVHLFGEALGRIDDPGAFDSNVACAVGVAAAFGVTPDETTLGRLERPPHRQNVFTNDRGVTIIDDTYNANPAGARAVLDALQRHGSPGGRRVLVTPGIIELGPRQFEENREFARRASSVATDMLVVGRTNRAALLEGAEGGDASVIVVDSREDAVAWVRKTLGSGDVVAYENDLPDHYA